MVDHSCAINCVFYWSIYFGAKDRIGQPQIQQSAFYKINEDSSVNGYYVESILTNRSGDFVVNADKNTSAVALRNSINFVGEERIYMNYLILRKMPMVPR